MLKKLNELKYEWNGKASRNTRLRVVYKIFSLLTEEKELEPDCFYSVCEVLFMYEISLETAKNEKVNTEKIENKVYLLYQNFIQSTKYETCKEEYARLFNEKNENLLNQLYETCLYWIHQKECPKKRLQIMNYCKSFYRDFTFLEQVLPVTPGNSYMFLNLCLFFKNNMLTKTEEIDNMLNKEALQKYRRKTYVSSSGG